MIGLAAATIFFLLPSTASSVTIPEEVLEARAHNARVSAIAEAILEAEGRCGEGQSGESGCFQYQPGTWAAYSTQVLGETVPMTEAIEREVTEGMIAKWTSEGRTPRWIFLTWNQGNGDGWGGGTDCYSGWNKWGVWYDSCDYAARAQAALERIEAS